MIRKKVLGTLAIRARLCRAQRGVDKVPYRHFIEIHRASWRSVSCLQEACRANLRFEVSFCAAHVAAK
jgi:hypothetical protein